jgi:hypothetical protein
MKGKASFMKKIIIATLGLFVAQIAFAQSWGDSQSRFQK